MMPARALAAAAFTCLAIAAAPAAAAPSSHTVAIDGTTYAPKVLTVKRGDTVTWVNKDPFPHTVTVKGLSDSKSIGAGQAWKYVASKSGRYEYLCTLHPGMAGTLIVE